MSFMTLLASVLVYTYMCIHIYIYEIVYLFECIKQMLLEFQQTKTEAFVLYFWVLLSPFFSATMEIFCLSCSTFFYIQHIDISYTYFLKFFGNFFGDLQYLTDDVGIVVHTRIYFLHELTLVKLESQLYKV